MVVKPGVIDDGLPFTYIKTRATITGSNGRHTGFHLTTVIDDAELLDVPINLLAVYDDKSTFINRAV